MNELSSLKEKYAKEKAEGGRIQTFPIECQRSFHCDGETIGTIEEIVDGGQDFYVAIEGFHAPDPVCEACQKEYQSKLVHVTDCEYKWDGRSISMRDDEWIELIEVEPGEELVLPAEDLPTKFFVFGDYITCPKCGEKTLWSKTIHEIKADCFFECSSCHFLMDAEPPSEWVGDKKAENKSDFSDRFKTGNELRED